MRKDICYLSFWVFVLFSSYTQNLRTFHNLCWEWEIVCNLPSIFCSWNHLSVHPPLGTNVLWNPHCKERNQVKESQGSGSLFPFLFLFFFLQKRIIDHGRENDFPMITQMVLAHDEWETRTSWAQQCISGILVRPFPPHHTSFDTGPCCASEGRGWKLFNISSEASKEEGRL